MRNPFSLEALLYWVENHKDPNETYEYFDVDNCALAQYCKFLGIDYLCAPHGSVWHLELVASDLGGIKTFGELAKDIREAIARHYK